MVWYSHLFMELNLQYFGHLMQKAESLERTLMPGKIEVVEESGKVGLKLNTQKTKIMASGPITSWQIDGKKKWKQ